MRWLRISGLAAGAGLVWLVVASEIPSHVRLPLDQVVEIGRASCRERVYGRV